jgi:hypothetical protein
VNLWWIYPGMVAASLIGAGIAHLYTKWQQRREARVQQQRAQRIEDIETRANGCHIDDAELADHIALWADDYHKQQREEQE